MKGSPNQVVTDITNAVADRVLTVGTVTDEQQDLNAEANLTFDGSTLTVAGNLTVTGTTTTVSTTNTVISDKLIELANGTSGTPSGDAGIVVETLTLMELPILMQWTLIVRCRLIRLLPWEQMTKAMTSFFMVTQHRPTSRGIPPKMT